MHRHDTTHDSAHRLVPDGPGAPRPRWFASSSLGVVLCLAVFSATTGIPEIAVGRRLEGVDYALVGLLQALLIPLALMIALKRP